MLDTPSGLLAAAVAAAPGRPLVTFYDHATDERVELSVATYANWVAKTANLLVDGLAAAPGGSLCLLGVPRHWQAAVCASASWAAGLVLVVDADPAGCDVAVAGPGGLERATSAGDALALSLRPLGAPFAEPLPVGVVDYAREVASYGDRFDGPPPAATDAALLAAGARTHQAGLVAAARALADTWVLGPHGRLLVAGPLGAVDELLAAAVVPLVTGGSVVLVAHPDPSRLARLAAQERVTASVPAG